MNIFNNQISLAKLRSSIFIVFAAFFLWPSAALAEIKSQSDNGFAIFHIADVAAAPDEIWSKLILPNSWWSSDHSWSGDADNLYLEPKVGGCFCELLKTETDGQSSDAGAVEHMRIIHIDRDRTLRMLGALGPLQSEAVNGTFTVAIKGNGDGTSKLSFLYVVGGYMRFEVSKIAPSIDRVVGEQFGNLIELIGPALPSEDGGSVKVEKPELLIDDKVTIIEASEENDIDEEEEKTDDEEVRRER